MRGRGWSNASSFWALAAVASAALAPPSQAGGCPPAAMSYSYSYAAPAVSYSTYSYAAPAVKTVYKTVYVPQAVKTAISPDYYSSSQDYYRDRLLVDAVAGKTAEALKMQEELSQLRQQVQQFQYQQQQQQQQWQSWQQPQPPPPRMPPANGYGGYNGHHAPQQQTPPGYGSPPQQQPQGRSSVPEGLEQAVAQDCRSCHGATKQEANIDLRNLEDMPWELRVLCANEVLAGTMPYGRDGLSPEKKALWQAFERMARPSVARR